MEEDTQIEGGATLWARQTVDSEIFYAKPAIWFKIWFYLVNRVSHKDTRKYERGETFYQQQWICDATGATADQVKKCLNWLREAHMISTRRSTAGTWLKILNYSHFQTLDNYYYKVKAPDKAPNAHEGSTKEARTYNKNDKNDKKIYSPTSLPEGFELITDDMVEKKEKIPPTPVHEWVTIWNKYPTWKATGARGTPPNPSVIKNLLPKATQTRDVQAAIIKKRQKYSLEEFNHAVKQYATEVCNRKKDKSNYHEHRFTLFEFLTHKSIFERYVNR